ncbi:MAG: cupin domain-containing protein [Armatimonadota bacterium]|nr:cupin domain-containing protein [Armatimonadota bacterium]
MSREPICRSLDEIESVDCSCGRSRRIITRDDEATVGFHVTEIERAEAHYHARTTEVYYVLEGSGRLLVAGLAAELRPDSVVYIPPGCVHRGEGHFTAAIALLPPFDPEDELSPDEELPRPCSRPIMRHVQQAPAARSACGSSRRVLTRDDGVALGLHVVHIQAADCHYHVRTTELYHVLEGEGRLRVGREQFELSPGDTVYVPAGLEHCGEGDFQTIVVCAPPFDPEDQIVV